MKNRWFVVVMLIACGSVVLSDVSSAQFKRSSSEEPKVSDSFIRPATQSDWLGFFNPENFLMRQSYSMSYTAMGGHGFALGTYTNSMLYKVSDKVDARVDVSLQHSPYSTFDQRLQNSLTGVFLNRAEVNYRPSENMLLSVSYRQIPFGSYGMNSMYGGFYHGLDNYEGY